MLLNNPPNKSLRSTESRVCVTYCSRLAFSIDRPTIVPPRTPIRLAYIVNSGIMTIRASILGSTRNSMGPIPRVFKASISSARTEVTYM